MELSGAFSPDGRWLAYYSDDSGSWEVYVRAFPDKRGKWQTSNGGGVYPAWSGNGRELFYRTQDNQTMVVNYTAKGDSFVAEKPRVWSEKRIANVSQFINYDPAPDANALAIMPAETPEVQSAKSHAIFVLNFFDELRRRVFGG